MATDPRSKHPKLARALQRLEATDLTLPCAEAAPAELIKAIDEFNAGEFFEQHETLELLWRATPGEIRHLYEGILQIGVGMYHLLKKRNFHGAAVKLDHGIRLLAPFPAVCHGVDVARLRRDATAARTHLLELGPQRLDGFDCTRIPRVHLVSGEVADSSSSHRTGEASPGDAGSIRDGVDHSARASDVASARERLDHSARASDVASARERLDVTAGHE